MTAVKAHYDGYAFVPESPIFAEINQEAIVTVLDRGGFCMSYAKIKSGLKKM